MRGIAVRSHLPLATLLALVTSLPSAGAAQLIGVRTLPSAPDYQFDLFPSRTAGMGGVTIAVADPLLDPFVNPARAVRVEESRLFGSPGIFSVTGGPGGGRTLPLGALAKAGPWFGGIALGLQQVDLTEEADPLGPDILRASCAACTSPTDPGQPESAGNRYGFATLGRDLGKGLSVGGSVRWSWLHAVDGVMLRYPGSARLDQLGSALDVRFGALKEWSGDRSLDVLLLYHRFSSEHEALYFDSFFDPGTQTMVPRERTERSLDRTQSWGLHVEHERPLGSEGWHIGWLGTVNLQKHPAIPDYELARVSQDRGRSTALNLGVGFSRSEGSSTFGIDLVYEPIWSRGWAAAGIPIEALDGTVIPADGEVLENRYRFSNALLRMGIADEVELTDPETLLGLQLGLAIRSVDYRLDQTDHVQLRAMRSSERWTEWTPTWGLSLRRPAFEIHYRGQGTGGIRTPDVRRAGGFSGCFDVCVLEGAVTTVVAPRPGSVVGTTSTVSGTSVAGASTPPAVVGDAIPGVPPPADPMSIAVHQITFSVPLGWGGRTRAPSREQEQEGSR